MSDLELESKAEKMRKLRANCFHNWSVFQEVLHITRLYNVAKE